jgi:hypothetical protein
VWPRCHGDDQSAHSDDDDHDDGDDGGHRQMKEQHEPFEATTLQMTLDFLLYANRL